MIPRPGKSGIYWLIGILLLVLLLLIVCALVVQSGYRERAINAGSRILSQELERFSIWRKEKKTYIYVVNSNVISPLSSPANVGSSIGFTLYSSRTPMHLFVYTNQWLLNGKPWFPILGLTNVYIGDNERLCISTNGTIAVVEVDGVAHQVR